MAAVIARLEAVDGLEEYVVVDKEGHVAAHRATDPETLGSAVTICGLACEAVRASLESSGFRYLALADPGGADLIVLEAAGHFVGLSRTNGGKGGSTPAELCRRIATDE